MAGSGNDGDAAEAEVREILARADMAVLADLAEGFAAAVAAALPAGAMLDRSAVLRAALSTVLLAEAEGRKAGTRSLDAERRRARTLQAVIDKQDELIGRQNGLADKLQALVENQDEIIARQAEALRSLGGDDLAPARPALH